VRVKEEEEEEEKRTHAELDESDAESGARAIFGGVGRVEEVGEEEACSSLVVSSARLFLVK
jgi:hypothetical protein